jgi:hypothetical protein
MIGAAGPSVGGALEARPTGRDRIPARLRSLDPLLAALVVSAAAYFAYRYAIEPTRPGMAFQRGWFGYFDQSQYLRMAHDLSEFRLPAGHFLYGVGFPIVAVPFLWLGLDYDPWLLFDGTAFVFAAAATFVVAGRIFGRLAAGIAGFGLVFATPLISYCLTPWNSTVSLVALTGILLLGTSPRPAKWHPYVIGSLVAWAFAARYVDALWLGAIGAVALARSPSGRTWTRLLAAGATAAVLATPILIAHQRAFGSPFTTPYSLHAGIGNTTTDEQWGAYDLGRVPRSAFGMFISPFLLGAKQPGSPLLADMFWTIAAIPGAVIAFVYGRFRLLLIATVVGWIAASVFYLSFRGTGAGGIQFGTLHYFKMWWPVASILAAGAFAWVVNFGGSRFVTTR